MTLPFNVYDYTLKDGLRVLELKEMTDEWLDFVVACRSGQMHDFDIVIGAMADDQIYNYVADFIRGVITREQFWALAKFKYPTLQIAFCTEAALECLTENGYFDNDSSARYAIPSHWDIGKVYQRLILDVAHATDGDIINTLIVVYNSWITRKIDNYNSSMYYENPGYLFESYKTGAVLA